MKILFANVPWWEMQPDGSIRQGIRAGSRWPFTKHCQHEPGKFKFGGYLPFPFFLAHSAAHTKMLMPEVDVQIRDSIARGETYSEFMAAEFDFDADFIVIESATSSLAHDMEILDYPMFKESKFILCGPIDRDKHAEIFEKHPNVHAIVQGEYDKQIAAAINAPRGTVLAHNLLTREEMAASPLPIWDEACATNYWDPCPRGQRAPHIQLWASRGCPFRCCFCSWPAVMTGNDPDGTKPRSVRFYPPEYVERHIIERMKLHKYESVYFDDDTFNLNEKHTLEICAVMKKIGLPWSAMCRADTISRDAWREMRRSGCFGVKIGFESGSQYVIDHIVNKKLDLKEAAATTRFLKSIGMTVHGTFTMGLPGETPEMRKETAAFIKSLPLDTHQLSGTGEISGTPLDTIRKKGSLAKYDGAVMSPDYKVMSDGQRKIEEMRSVA